MGHPILGQAPGGTITCPVWWDSKLCTWSLLELVWLHISCFFNTCLQDLTTDKVSVQNFNEIRTGYLNSSPLKLAAGNDEMFLQKMCPDNLIRECIDVSHWVGKSNAPGALKAFLWPAEWKSLQSKVSNWPVMKLCGSWTMLSASFCLVFWHEIVGLKSHKGFRKAVKIGSVPVVLSRFCFCGMWKYWSPEWWIDCGA